MGGKEAFLDELATEVGFQLSEDQSRAALTFIEFLRDPSDRSSFLLKGYAGTGKTTLAAALIRWMHKHRRKTILMAPTGRAAKVLSSFSGYPASTIHRRIYSVKQDDSGRFTVRVAENTSKNVIYIIDEASMIGDAGNDDQLSARSLLDDVIRYVQMGENCKLMFIGDEAQLPPVGSELSPALDANKISGRTSGAVHQSELREVVRQGEHSLTLQNATALRELIRTGKIQVPKLVCDRGRDCRLLDSSELGEQLESVFGGRGASDAVIICRSNKDASKFNAQIRRTILSRENEVEAGDRLMVVKNNYYWKIASERQNFLANGDMVTVERVHAIRTMGAYRFAECRVRLGDEEGVSLETTLLLNAIDYDGPSIPSKELMRMRNDLIVSGELQPTDPDRDFFAGPWLNAVQVKYAYAITCHKAQGGQWAEVFVYPGYFTDAMLDRSYLRWLYTALTRTTDTVWLCGLRVDFLEK